MKRQGLYSALLAGTLGISTLCLFYTGANALDLGDFTGTDQKVITQDAPKAGGAVLVKENVVYTQPKVTRAYATAPRGMQSVTLTSSQPLPSRSIVAGVVPEQAETPAPGFLNRNTTSGADDPYARVQNRMHTPGVASAPVDGNPWHTTTLANGARVNELNNISPAAGGGMVAVQANSSQSVQSMTGRGQDKAYNR